MLRALPGRIWIPLAALGTLLGGCDSPTDAGDTAPPTVVIASPDSLVDAPRVKLRGTAADESGVERVAYQVNGGPERALEIAPGPAVEFNVEIALPEVTNTLAVNAYDQAGNANSQVVSVRRRGLAFESISVESTVTCALTANRVPYCWGYGYGFTPVDVFGGRLRVKSIVVSGLSACGLTERAETYCWYPRQGTSTLVVVLSRVNVGAPLTELVGVLSGGALGLTADGVLYRWNLPAGVSFSPPTDPVEPTQIEATRVKVSGDLRFRTVGGTWFSTCGLTADGTAYCWNRGFGSTPDSAVVPTAVPGGLSFRSIGVEERATCGLTAEGAAYCWGDNSRGQLGTGSSERSDVPVRVAGGLTFRSIDTGLSHACGVTEEGVGYCWGYNNYGQQGTGNAGVNNLVPTRVQGSRTFAVIRAGYDYTCGLSRIGVAYCWGANARGEAGVSPAIYPHVPTPVAGSVVEDGR